MATSDGEVITILSVDGGGVKGIIPATILAFLESQLQELDGEEARLVDYFDVIAGTSVGGILVSMITAPNKLNRPLFPAKAIVPFLLVELPLIFPYRPVTLERVVKSLSNPIFNGKYLHTVLKLTFGEKRLNQMLTNVVISCFDIKLLTPDIFSSYKIKNDPSIDALISDICIGTAATPAYLPAYYFENTDAEGKTREFNTVDGFIVAENPTLVAISEATMGTEAAKKGSAIENKGPLKFKAKAKASRTFLVLSLGTGQAENQMKYNAKMAADWGVLNWSIDSDLQSPIIDSYFYGSADMVDYYVSTIFGTVQDEANYLRIQDDKLTTEEANMFNTSKEHLTRLVEIGNELLDKPVMTMNIETGTNEPVPGGGTNREALIEFAKTLSAQRKVRSAKALKK